MSDVAVLIAVDAGLAGEGSYAEGATCGTGYAYLYVVLVIAVQTGTSARSPVESPEICGGAAGETGIVGGTGEAVEVAALAGL